MGVPLHNLSLAEYLAWENDQAGRAMSSGVAKSSPRSAVSEDMAGSSPT